MKRFSWLVTLLASAPPRVLVALALTVPAAVLGAERFAVIAAGDPPGGPDGDLVELTYQLRAACRDRVPNVLDPSDMRGRLLGRTSSASESELDRAYGGALAVYQNGEFDSSLRTLRAVVEDLESLPETEESYFQWKRANLRLALSAMAMNDSKEVEGAFGKVLRVEPGLQPDPDQYSPGFRKRFEEARARIRALPRRRLTVTAEGRQGTIYVNGKNMGVSPLTLSLPAGAYRVGGGAGSLRVPSFRVDLQAEDRAVILDFALADSLRMNGGPGLALAPADRANGVVRAGAWLGVDRLVVVSRSDEGQAHFLVGSIYDVLRGALLREGSVRMVAGGVPSVNLSALAAFLLTGQASREVKDLAREASRRVAETNATSEAPPHRAAAPPAEPGRPQADPGKPAEVAPALVLANAPIPYSPARAATTTAPSPPIPIAPPAPAARPVAPAVPPVTGPVKNPAPPIAASAAATSGASSPAPRPDLDIRSSLLPKEKLALDDPRPAPTPPRRPAWKRPVTIATGVLALGLGGLALQQKSASDRAYSSAARQLSGNAFKDVAAHDRYYALVSDGDRARTRATVAAGAAAVCAVTAVVLGWTAWRTPAEPSAGIKVEF
jgi:hypothetical protein